ncbi:Vsp/OspC family lipoprotein (plasmid) [Borrelia puertoricensis]
MRERNNEKKRNKRINSISGIAILLMIIGMIIGCDTGVAKSGQDIATKADGEKIDLAGISTKIKSAIAFAEKVKEVETLVKSIDELAKAILFLSLFLLCYTKLCYCIFYCFFSIG